MSAPQSRIERQAYKWVMKMLDDPGRHASALERWLSKNEEHRAVYRRVAVEVGKASDSAAQHPFPRAVVSGHVERPAWRAKAPILAGGCLAVVAAIAIAILGPSSVWHSQVPSPQFVSEQRTYASEGTKKVLTLADNSVVTLYSGSRIATHFSDRERSIDLLVGRARFAVAHNAARPFVVYAGGGRVTATGTLFEVALSQRISVRLISGSVEVSMPATAGASSRRIIRLKPGEQAAYALQTNDAVPTPTPSVKLLSPRVSESFDDVPAGEIADKVNRSSATKIVFADPADAKRLVVADFSNADTDSIAVKLSVLLGLIVDRTEPGRLLLKKAD